MNGEHERKKSRARTGSGSVFKPKGSRNWYVAYYTAPGRQITESSRSNVKAVAQSLLQTRLEAVGRGDQQPQRAAHLLLAELLMDVLLDYKTNGQATLGDAESRIRLHLAPFFKIDVVTEKEGKRLTGLSGGVNALSVRNVDAQRYILLRRAEGAKDASIANELALLRRALNLAVKNGKLPHAAYIGLPANADRPREAFLEPAQYRELMSHLPEHMKPLVSLAFHTGMRRGELVKIKCDQVDLDQGVLYLSAKETKTKEARVIPIPAEPLAMLRIQKLRRDAEDPSCQVVFFRPRRLCVDGPGSKLVPIGDYRVGWKKAVAAAGLTKLVEEKGFVFHSLRNSAIRQLMRSGVSQTVAMKISGHRTVSVFQRYNCTSFDDLKDAAQKLDKHLAQPDQPVALVSQEENETATLPHRVN